MIIKSASLGNRQSDFHVLVEVGFQPEMVNRLVDLDYLEDLLELPILVSLEALAFFRNVYPEGTLPAE